MQCPNIAKTRWCRTFSLFLILCMVCVGQGITVSALALVSKEDAESLMIMLRNTNYASGYTLESIPYVTETGVEDTFSLFEVRDMDGYGNTPEDEAVYQLLFPTNIFNALNKDKQKDILDTFAYALQDNSGVSEDAQRIIVSELRFQLEDVDDVLRNNLLEKVQPDTMGAGEILEPIVRYFGLVSGVIVVLLSVSLTLFTVIDLMYIILPPFKEYADSHAYERKGGQKRPLFVSNEAITAVNDSIQDSTYINPLIIYFKRRVFVIFILALCLVFLIGGYLPKFIIALYSMLNDAFGGWGTPR